MSVPATLGSGLREVLDAEREVVASDIYAVGSMLSYDERLLLHWAARTAGSGAVVDLGSFLGGSTLALACGARHRGARVYAYDRFVLAGDWEREWLPPGTGIAIDGSTREVFETNVAHVRDRIIVREGEVEELGWQGDEIGVLFIDIAKSWSTADFVWRTFLPSLRPGAIVIQQDLVHCGHPWCAIVMEHLANHFEYLGWVWYSSAVYRCSSPITTVPEPLLEHFSCDELVSLVDQTADRIGEPARGAIRLSAARVYAVFDRFEEARARVATARRAFDDEPLPYLEDGCASFDRWISDVEAGRVSALN